jgi:hypothetical protein
MDQTMRTALLALSIFVSSFLNAQSWCPPGATWTYGIDFVGEYGYQQYTYVGDTVLGGYTGQRIASLTALQYWPDYTPITYYNYPLVAITSLQSDVVMLWSGTLNSWDTLLWFGAVPGAHWQRAHAQPTECDPMDRIIVQDTSTVIIDGLPLKHLDIGHEWNGGINWTSTITERLGWAGGFIIFPACIIVDGPTGMRCYSDDQISSGGVPYGCTSLMGLADSHANAIRLSPNPGTDQFTLWLPSGHHTITLFDTMGRVALQERTKIELATIGTTHLSPGIYIVRIDDGSSPVRWVKE